MERGTSSFGGDIVWRPTPQDIERSHLHRFMQEHGLDGFSHLMDRSTGDVAWFTDAVLKYLDVRFQQPYDRVVDLSEGMALPRWCVNGRLNITVSCLDKWADDPVTANRAAVIWEGEEGTTRTLSYAELRGEVNRCVNALRELGLGPGDAIGLHMPMCLEIVIALLGLLSLASFLRSPGERSGLRRS